MSSALGLLVLRIRAFVTERLEEKVGRHVSVEQRACLLFLFRSPSMPIPCLPVFLSPSFFFSFLARNIFSNILIVVHSHSNINGTWILKLIQTHTQREREKEIGTDLESRLSIQVF